MYIYIYIYIHGISRHTITVLISVVLSILSHSGLDRWQGQGPILHVTHAYLVWIGKNKRISWHMAHVNIHEIWCNIKKLQEKCQGPELRPTFCESLSSRNAHGHLTRAILCENLHEKCRAPEHPELRPTVCASLRSRNAHGHLARAILCDNLQGKCQGSDRAPWCNPGHNTYRKNPSV